MSQIIEQNQVETAGESYKIWKDGSQDKIEAFKNFAEMNYALGGGVDQGSLNLVVGESGLGKSSMLVSMALDLCLYGAGVPVLFFSVEMGRRKLIPRFVANLMNRSINWVEKARYSEDTEQLQVIHEAGLCMDSLPLEFAFQEPNSTVNISNIDIIYEQSMVAKEARGVAYVFIDHALELTVSKSSGNELKDMKYISDIMFKMMNSGITIFLAHQFKNVKEKKEIYGFRDKMDIYYAGYFVKRASNIFYLFRNEKQKEDYENLMMSNNPDKFDIPSKAMMKLLKARNGIEGAIFGLDYFSAKARFAIETRESILNFKRI